MDTGRPSRPFHRSRVYSSALLHPSQPKFAIYSTKAGRKNKKKCHNFACPLDCIETRILPGEKANECLVVLSLSNEAPAGMIDAKVTIVTGSPERKSHEVRLFGAVRDER